MLGLCWDYVGTVLIWSDPCLNDSTLTHGTRPRAAAWPAAVVVEAPSGPLPSYHPGVLKVGLCVGTVLG
jgi:hypothetical protein